MPNLVKKTSVAVKIETTQGTAAAPAATDFILCEEVDIKPINAEMVERNPYRNGLAPVSAIAGKRFAEVTFKTEIKNGGVAGTAYAPLGALLQACGMTETDGASDVTYTMADAPASGSFYSPGKTVTLNVYKDGRKHVIAGGVANIKGVAEAGKVGFFEFTVRGSYAEPTDASPGTETPNETQPPLVGVSALTLMGDGSRIAGKFDFDFGNEISERVDIESAGGLHGFLITGRAPVGTCDPEIDSLSTFNELNKLTSNTEASTSIVIGSVAGNIVTITFAKTQITGVSYGDRNGIVTGELALRFNKNASQSDFCSIVFT